MLRSVPMRPVVSCLAVCLALCGCEDVGRGPQRVGPAPGPPKAGVDANDAAVVEAALRHFLADPEVHTFGSTAGAHVVLYTTTVEKAGLISADQIAGEFKAGELPADALGALVARNTGPVPLGALNVNAGVAVLRPLPAPGSESHDDFGFARQEPGAKARVQIWLPGFTADGGHAVLRFVFGPTPHGATATYLLRRQGDGSWVVVWRKLTYYA